MSPGRCLVTGATGFLGGALVAAFAAEGRPIVATGRDPAGCERLRQGGVETRRIDLEQPDAVARLTAVGGIDTLVHCAALSAPWGSVAAFRRANIEATRAVLAAAGRLECRHVVHVSSPTVCFRFADRLGIREDEPLPRPVNTYAWSKGEAERLVAGAEGFGRTILRPRAIYGRGDRALLPRLAAACERGSIPLLRGGAAVTDPTHVDDLVAAVRAVLDGPVPAGLRTFNVSGGEAVPVRAMITEAAARLGIEPRWRALPWRPLLAAVSLAENARRLVGARGEPRLTRYSAGLLAFSQTLDIAAIGAATGWRPRIRFAEGLERTFS